MRGRMPRTGKKSVDTRAPEIRSASPSPVRGRLVPVAAAIRENTLFSRRQRPKLAPLRLRRSGWCPGGARFSRTRTTRSMSSMASGRRRKASTTLNTAVLAPIARPTDSTTTAVRPRFLRIVRRAERRSCVRESMAFLSLSLSLSLSRQPVNENPREQISRGQHRVPSSDRRPWMTISSKEDLAGMSRVGRLVGEAIQLMKGAVRVGMTTAELDQVGADFLRGHGARSAPQLTYNFPGFNLISVNEQIVHGVPGPRRLEPGDVVKID